MGLIVVWLRADFRLCRATWEGVIEGSATWVGDLGNWFVVGSRVCWVRTRLSGEKGRRKQVGKGSDLDRGKHSEYEAR